VSFKLPQVGSAWARESEPNNVQPEFERPSVTPGPIPLFKHMPDFIHVKFRKISESENHPHGRVTVWLSPGSLRDDHDP
jgi:hypothetical protein